MIRLNRLFAVAIPVVWMLMGALMAVVLWAGGVLTLGGGMEVGQITAVTEYSILTMGYLLMAVSVLTTLPKARACLAASPPCWIPGPTWRTGPLPPLWPGPAPGGGV